MSIKNSEINANETNLEFINFSRKNENGELEYMSHCFEGCETMYDILPNGLKQTTDGKCLGRIDTSRRKLRWITYEDVIRRCKNFADGLLQLGLKPLDKFGIYTANCPEYTMAEYACYRHSIVVVPIFETFGLDMVAFIANQVKLSTIFCDSIKRATVILDNIEQFPMLKSVIVIQKREYPFDGSAFKFLREKFEALTKVKLYTFFEIENLGVVHPEISHLPHVDDLAVIIYTSGTFGSPKGVMLSHKNIVANISAMLYNLAEHRLNSGDTLISYLPLGHILGRIFEAIILSVGGKIGYYSGDVKQLSDDVQIIKPTIFPCFLSVLHKIYNRIYAHANKNFVKRWLLQNAYHYKKEQLRNGKTSKIGNILDSLVFNQILEQLGGRIRMISVTSASMDRVNLDFFRCAIGCPILVGYGLSECAGVCTSTSVGDYSVDNAGFPLASCSIKLIDVPEMNCFAVDGRGEIAIKGPIVFKGYYLNSVQTDEAIDSDGWLHTGDIGQWNKDDSLQIVDRKNDLFKLSNGEFIVPSKIEEIYSRCPFLEQIFVYGNNFKLSLVAIVVPKLGCKQRFGWNDTKDENNYIKLQNFQELILESMKTLGIAAKLQPFEQVKDIHLASISFSTENGLLTPTFKNKRSAIAKLFDDEIKNLYLNLESNN